MIRVLIVEDSPDIALGVRDHLSQTGCEPRIAATGREALQMLVRWSPDVIVLDLMLPDISGYDVLRQMRARADETPVLILSAKSDEMAKVRGFRVGADDYVTKPFSLRELSARVHALGRRWMQQRATPEVIRVETIEIEPRARRVTANGEEVSLRPKELDLLLTLIEHPREVVSRTFLLAQVWSYEPGVESRTVDWHVAELRKKLGDDVSAPHLIETVRKAGYRWVGTITGA